jgi:hypothetical protein
MTITDLFLENKYTKIYYDIINRAKSRQIKSYKERHHIIPQSLGGNNLVENIVDLTAREHFICHLLLTKMLQGENKKKMTFALWLLCNVKNPFQQERYIPNSITYEKIRTAHADNMSQKLKGVKKTKIHWLNKKHTEETKSKQSLVKKGKLNPMFGKTQTEESKKLKSLSQVGISKPIFICNCCGKSVGGKSNLLRWHNSNCKENQNY